jgi:hypothetical protein
MKAYRWLGETFGLATEDDCIEAFELAFDERFIVAKYDDQGRIEHFRGRDKQETKTRDLSVEIPS